MESSQTTTNQDCYPHQPEDYSHFKRMVTDLRPWLFEDYPEDSLMIGECPHCRSTISYPMGPSAEDFKDELVAA